MKEELVFYERQRFTQWWLIVLLFAVNGVFLYGCIKQIVLGDPFGNRPTPDAIFIFMTVFMFLLSASFFFIRLDTVINEEGVYFRMFPFHIRFKFKSWEQISEAGVKKINPITELGGWGMRYKLRFGLRRGRSGIYIANIQSYTLSGNKVLQLVLNNNKELYIGTRRPDELSEFLSKLDVKRKQN